jgi:hypothetical protein
LAEVDYTEETKHYAACMRLLSDPPAGHRFYYVTDIDMMILPEKPTLMEFHIGEMAKTGWCYSNSIRGFKEQRGIERMTGLHFFAREWLDVTAKERMKAMEDIRVRGAADSRIADEIILKRVCEKSGLQTARMPGGLFIRHHGIHLGTLRAYRHQPKAMLNEALRSRISVEQASQWQEYWQSRGCRVANEAMKAHEAIRFELEYLDKWTKGRMKG